MEQYDLRVNRQEGSRANNLEIKNEFKENGGYILTSENGL